MTSYIRQGTRHNPTEPRKIPENRSASVDVLKDRKIEKLKLGKFTSTESAEFNNHKDFPAMCKGKKTGLFLPGEYLWYLWPETCLASTVSKGEISIACYKTRKCLQAQIILQSFAGLTYWTNVQLIMLKSKVFLYKEESLTFVLTWWHVYHTADEPGDAEYFPNGYLPADLWDSLEWCEILSLGNLIQLCSSYVHTTKY